MKKTVLLAVAAITNIAFANDIIREEYDAKPMIEGNTRVQELMDWAKDHPGEMPPLTEQEKYEFFIKKGIPLPGTGASAVESTKNLSMTKEQSEMVMRFNAAQKNQGYFEMENRRAKALLAMPETAEKEYNARKSVAFNPQDTHLYEVKTTLQMNYPYKGVPAYLTSKVIGYAPESVFIDKGWAGAVEFFVPDFGGICAFHEVNIELTKSSAYIPKEIVTYKVNNKLTKINVVGNKNSGFVYEVEWWDKTFKHNLECASKNYSDPMRALTLKLAQNIDKA